MKKTYREEDCKVVEFVTKSGENMKIIVSKDKIVCQTNKGPSNKFNVWSQRVVAMKSIQHRNCTRHILVHTLLIT